MTSILAFLYFKFTKLKKEISLSILFYIESIILIQYATEFILRLFSCGCKAKFHGFKGRFRFMRQFFPLLGESRLLIDVKNYLFLDLTTLTVTAVIVYQSLSMRSRERAVLPASVLRQLRALRFLQVVRMIRVDRRGSSWKLLASVLRFINQIISETIFYFRTHVKELLTSIYLGLITLILMRNGSKCKTLCFWPNGF